MYDKRLNIIRSKIHVRLRYQINSDVNAMLERSMNYTVRNCVLNSVYTKTDLELQNQTLDQVFNQVIKDICVT